MFTRIPLILSLGFAVSPLAVPLLQGETLFQLNQVRLHESPFTVAAQANQQYMLALNPDRLLAPFLVEAGLPPKADVYGNWEEQGLAGHTAGHYLSALADMIASGNDTPDRALAGRLDYMLDELERCQKANGNGYIGGIPGSRKLWQEVASGQIDAHGFGLNGTWVPWYNLHKTFAGLRDAYQVAGREQALQMLIGLADWCDTLTHGLNDAQMQDMLRSEHGAMNEVLADLYVITGDDKYLALARRFNHHAVLDPILAGRDELTGKHANTQIPKVIGMERIGALIGNRQMQDGAAFFWKTVTQERSVVFGGNSVGEHFNDPSDFRGMLESREGPETCNTYNMLHLTEMLFEQSPSAEYADYYEEALYNHILSAINCTHPGYVYFTPIRPEHYRVYSQPEKAFWCCVGTGMENPGKYGKFIYTQPKEGDIRVNLFIPSKLDFTGGTLIQETSFPEEPVTRLTFSMKEPATFKISIRHPQWVSAEGFQVWVNGEKQFINSDPQTYVSLTRRWQDGDRIEVKLPMALSVEKLPDGSPWVAFKYGPIVLVHPAGADDLEGLYADDSRMGHVAHGSLVPMDKAPVLISEPEDLLSHISADEDSGPLHFLLEDIVEPSTQDGLPLVPFYNLHGQRYQMYWNAMTRDEWSASREKLREEEAAKASLEAATLDFVAIGEQQPEVEHNFSGKDTETGMYKGHHWRHGKDFQYTLNTRGYAKQMELSVTYSGEDSGRTFEISVNGVVIATEELDGSNGYKLFDKHYPLPSEIIDAAADNKLTVRFRAVKELAGGIYGLRLLRTE
ncbi:MAG: glycoside hydrolase family 127 protein [Opitutales bacterium]|nr:glycoside hydrolase family 127 protein [Opitutales bacterium]